MHRFLILFGLSLLMSCTPREERAREYLESGRLHLLAGEFSEALEALDQAIRIDSTQAEAYLYRGSAHFNLRDVNDAISDYSKAIALSPAMADAWFNRGNAWFYLNDRDKACADWKEAERLGKPNVRDKTRHCL